MSNIPSFSNTDVAFKSKSTGELKFTSFIFSMMGSQSLVNSLTGLTTFALKIHLPIQWIVKKTIFKQFCGGEKIEECTGTYGLLQQNNIEAILDYSVEGQTKESDFDHVRDELLQLVSNAKKYAKVPTTCLKVTGIASFSILEKMSANSELSETEKQEYNRLIQRLEAICKKAFDNGVKIYIDAEETWIQVAIDRLAEVMMQKYNGKEAIVYTTVQMYRHDRLAYLQGLIEKSTKQSFVLGVKIVRGAYLEKENERAIVKGYATPMQPNKPSTDKDYNAALKLILDNIQNVELCAGTHNEDSAKLLCELMEEKGLDNSYKGIFFSQLYGMSDNISFNLAHTGYNVSKYLPYGPVRDTLPYLIRRARENTSIAGQMGRELALITKELSRRRAEPTNN